MGEQNVGEDLRELVMTTHESVARLEEKFDAHNRMVRAALYGTPGIPTPGLVEQTRLNTNAIQELNHTKISKSEVYATTSFIAILAGIGTQIMGLWNK